MSESNAIANIEAQIAAEAADMVKALSDTGGSSISNKGKRFTLPDGQVLDTINVVILDQFVHNVMYKKAYNPKQTSEPDCQAIGKLTEMDTMGPDDTVANKYSDTCAECPNNEFGSKGDGKACSNKLKVQVLMPGTNKVMELNIPPTGVKPWKQSTKAVMGQFGSLIKAIVQIEFDPSVDFPKPILTTAQPNPDYIDHFSVKTNLSLPAPVAA